MVPDKCIHSGPSPLLWYLWTQDVHLLCSGSFLTPLRSSHTHSDSTLSLTDSRPGLIPLTLWEWISCLNSLSELSISLPLHLTTSCLVSPLLWLPWISSWTIYYHSTLGMNLNKHAFLPHMWMAGSNCYPGQSLRLDTCTPGSSWPCHQLTVWPWVCQSECGFLPSLCPQYLISVV